MRARATRTLLILIGVLGSPASLADRVQIPLGLDHHFIELLLREQVFTGEGGSVRLNDDGTGCQFLQLRQPRVSATEGRVHIRTLATARVGRTVGGRCLLILDWSGQLEFEQEPVVGEDRQSIVLRTTSWQALGTDGQPTNLSTSIAPWLDQFLPDGLKQTRISFTQPISELKAFLALIVPADAGSRTDAMLDSITIDRITAENDRATVVLGMDSPAAGQAPQPMEPALSAAELTRLEQQLGAVDAFFTYTIKSVLQGQGEQQSAELLDVLMNLRYELIAILGDAQRPAEDPARALFVHSWDGLAPILSAIADQQSDRNSVLRYIAFISAGDALRALDDLGPAAGIEVSSDGLRRLARILIPGEVGDPLQRDDSVDPGLRKSFGFGEPLPPPQAYNDASWVDWFIPRAVAAATLDPASVKRLNNWVPKPQDMPRYLPMVRDVLQNVVVEQLRTNALSATYHELFRWLVFTTAWQESCWRQFEAKNNKRVPVQSRSGDIGMMQINPKVWRGFYDIQGLRWDIAYNARAGADILEHHLVNYAIRHREHQVNGGMDNLARSTYAAYNGGPREYDRYRRKNAPVQGKKVDALFYQKYREVKNGGNLAVTGCYAG